MSAGRPVGPNNWGVFGPDDELGTLNLQTPERVVAAARCIRTGERFPLNLPLPEPVHPDTGLAAMKPDVAPFARTSFRHNLESNQLVMNDDEVSFPTQGSSQWDSLAHIGMEEPGVDGVFYNGWSREAVDDKGAARRGGVDAFARAGIVGRGVLLDIARMVTGGDGPLERTHVITPQETLRCAAAQGVEIEIGDIVCFRTGWSETYLAADRERRRAMLAKQGAAAFPPVPGIDPGHADLAKAQGWSAVASDNVAVEALPMPPGPRSAHVRMLRNLGLPFAELLEFGALGRACQRDRRWEFLFVAVPLYIPGGIGSPANAIAIR
jgi:kynurenine formamidase